MWWGLAIDNTQAKQILEVIKDVGDNGITRQEISEAVKDKGCDCENWINTFLEAGIIEKCGKRGRADLFRFVE